MSLASIDRYDYYLKIILNSSVRDYPYIVEEYQNDAEISESEAESLDRIVMKYMGIYRKSDVKIVNTMTGQEETAPLTIIDDFGGNAVYVGEQTLFGILWKIYQPPAYIERPIVNKWYYNEKIASILNEILYDAVPGKVKNYFDTPPWIIGTRYGVQSRYMPLYEIIIEAINRNLIPGWYYLARSGLSQEFIEAIRNRSFQI
ncbi:TVG1296716 [Thermoplasma volcanium GSS1]|uniref:TVG1296716 protein n=1 Tax=Thermoplasma volcanium (strain ATCC 51530 / DSM 4299 / JCM 9571 / NBRC 15438 / GSS1) TaxID=273116 RepID=Q979A4_THEVO|nr:hypothetical protein [Thermoplasma volcanium]BAB60400.1 TVG1296716 [Thermoplasma volcanium GSS1]